MCYMCLHPFVSTCYKWFRVCEPMFLNTLNYVSLCRRFLRAYVPTSQNKPLQIHDREKYGYSHLFSFSWHYDVVVITTAQLHSTKPKLRHCAGSNPARGVSEILEAPDGNKAKRLSSINHTTKAIYHDHHDHHHHLGRGLPIH